MKTRRTTWTGTTILVVLLVSMLGLFGCNTSTPSTSAPATTTSTPATTNTSATTANTPALTTSTSSAATTTAAAGAPVVITVDKAADYQNKDVTVSVTSAVAAAVSSPVTMAFLGGGMGVGLGVSIQNSLADASLKGKTITVTGKVTKSAIGGPEIEVTSASQITTHVTPSASTSPAATTTAAAGAPVVMTFDKAADYIDKDVIVSVTAVVTDAVTSPTRTVLLGSMAVGLGVRILDPSVDVAALKDKTITVTGKVTTNAVGAPEIVVTSASQITVK